MSKRATLSTGQLPQVATHAVAFLSAVWLRTPASPNGSRLSRLPPSSACHLPLEP